MLMPIVSMNKMSMNESVAASCCWRYVLGVHEQYPEILHGGKIGTTYEVKLTLKGDYAVSGVKSGWLALPYDVAVADAKLNISYNPGRDDWFWQYGGEDYYIKENPNLLDIVKSPCPHNDGSCSYYQEVPVYQQDMHIGATSAHANEKKWDEPHKAVQYSS